MPSRIWQFALGAVVFLALYETSTLNALRVADHPRIRSLLSSGIIPWPALGCGLVMIAGSAVFLHPHLGYPGFWALIPSLGTALVIAAGHFRAGRCAPNRRPPRRQHPGAVVLDGSGPVSEARLAHRCLDEIRLRDGR
jgi:peptidoglycan/LPS O-acetylase OafA/YrhL